MNGYFWVLHWDMITVDILDLIHRTAVAMWPLATKTVATCLSSEVTTPRHTWSLMNRFQTG